MILNKIESFRQVLILLFIMSVEPFEIFCNEPHWRHYLQNTMDSFYCSVLHIPDATQRRRLCNLSKADRSIDSLPGTYESPVRILKQFYFGWKKDATAVQEEEGRKRKNKRQPRRIRESVAIPAAFQLGEFHVMHRESRLHASNRKRRKITLPFCRLDSHHSWHLYLLLFIYVY